MKKLVTERDLEDHGPGDYPVTPEMILTPSARDYASRNGIKLIWPDDPKKADDDSDMDKAIREMVMAELGHADPSVLAAVRSALPGSPAPRRDRLKQSPASLALRAAIEGTRSDRAVLSAMGKNTSGILAKVTGTISEMGLDIVNVSQTIVGGYFTMIVIIELGGRSFDTFRDKLVGQGKALGIEVMLMHEDVLQAMHRV